MKKKHRISEVARFFNISRQTLIYYDKIGLFKPEYIQEDNSYRYYSSQQFSELRFILTLRDSGFSLEEIKKYVQNRSREDNLEFLEGKSRAVQERIEELRVTKKIIDKKIAETKKLMIDRADEPVIKNVETTKALLVEVVEPYGNLEFERAFLTVNQLGRELPFDGKRYLITVDKENIEAGRYLNTKSLGVVLPEDIDPREEKNLKGGRVATIIHRGALNNIGVSYERLKKYILEKGYEITGDSREIHNQVFVYLEDGAGTTVEIQIPVGKKSRVEI